MAARNWQVYIVRCADNSLYTGITTDVQRRFAQHKAGTGAKFFRSRAPLEVVYVEDGHNRSSASCREAQIKKLSAVQKRNLLSEATNQLNGLVIQ